MNKIIVAIDGYSGCGKSTLARQLADKLQYIYIDTGAMYRAITYYLLENKVALSDEKQIEAALKKISLQFSHYAPSANNEILMNGKAVEEFIRTMKVTEKVSEVAAIPLVRRFAVKEQRKIGSGRGVVMDGRDIGTVVFPDAELKIFLTAALAVRVNRRYLELLKKGTKVSREAIKNNLEKRDYADSHRMDSPLRQADDAIVIDNSHLNPDQQLKKALDLAKNKLERR